MTEGSFRVVGFCGKLGVRHQWQLEGIVNLCRKHFPFWRSMRFASKIKALLCRVAGPELHRRLLFTETLKEIQINVAAGLSIRESPKVYWFVDCCVRACEGGQMCVTRSKRESRHLQL